MHTWCVINRIFNLCRILKDIFRYEFFFRLSKIHHAPKKHRARSALEVCTDFDRILRWYCDFRPLQKKAQSRPTRNGTPQPTSWNTTPVEVEDVDEYEFVTKNTK